MFDNIISAAQSLSCALAYLQKDAICSEFFAHSWTKNPEFIDEAMRDAKEAADFMRDMGQTNIIAGICEAIEASSWQFSPCDDMEEHQQKLARLFDRIAEYEIPEEKPFRSEEAESQAANLEKLLSL